VLEVVGVELGFLTYFGVGVIFGVREEVVTGLAFIVAEIEGREVITGLTDGE